MKLAPIGMSVYTRINHFERSIEALMKNTLASESELFIYSDAASKKEDESLVQRVRDFAHGITGFKNVSVIERESNYGGVKNSWLAWKEVVGKGEGGKSIYIEDDIVTAPGFLAFINGALDFYQNDENILSITGYSPPMDMPIDYKNDIFVLPRAIGWGMGAFDRTVEIASQRIDKQIFESIEDKTVFTVAGEDVLDMIELEANGQLNAGDVRCMYYQALHSKYTVYPRESLVQNIGLDGGGEHCRATDKFNHDQLWKKVEGFKFEKNIQADSEILKRNHKFRGSGIMAVCKRVARRLGILSFIRKVMLKW